MTDYVFLGPSLSREDAGALHDAVYLPPVVMGDVHRLVRTTCREGDRIAIVDGLFEQVPAVWHKEILFALDAGYPVYGASSMGALRAAECHPFGMIGVGRIFEAYRDGEIEDDDEVAVSHAPEDRGFRSLSTAMISIRFALEDARDRGKIEPDLAAALIAEAKRQPYHQRSWGQLLISARSLGCDEADCDLLRDLARRPDAKAADARALLQALAGEERPSMPERTFVFQHTTFWQGFALARSMSGNATAEPVQGAQAEALDLGIAGFFRAAGRGRDEILDLALLDRLVEVFAAEFEPSDRDVAIAAHRLKQRLGAGADGRPAISAAAIDKQAVLDARRKWLLARFAANMDLDILRRLELRGDLAEFAEQVLATIEEQRSKGEEKSPFAASGLSLQDLEAWYRRRCGSLAPHPEEHAKSLGFASLRQFVDHASIVYLADQDKPSGDKRRPDLPVSQQEEE